MQADNLHYLTKHSCACRPGQCVPTSSYSPQELRSAGTHTGFERNARRTSGEHFAWMELTRRQLRIKAHTAVRYARSVEWLKLTILQDYATTRGTV